MENDLINGPENNIKVVKTDDGAKDGQNKCPKCGATDISLNVNNGKLRCNYCRHEFEQEKIGGMETNIENLQGEVMGSGAADIIADTNEVVTLKCSCCGAEVVIDTSQSTQARCHWCRNTLSINQQIPNGAIPDVVLPFSLKKEEAKNLIQSFVGKRKFFAHPQFVKEFTTDNIMGVYFPYMVVDVNGHAYFKGQGEHEVRRYTRGSNENKKTYYDADLYEVGRDFDITIEGLTVETNSDKLKNDKQKTNNIINSIMPFDIENSVKYNANYLKGYSSEKRDTNVDQLRPLVDAQTKDIARFAANESLKQYDRGVKWQVENLDVKGKQWKTAYLPVWLYSYQEKKGGNNSLLHYVAVNARTKETMGSVPIHMPKLFGMSALVELAGFIAMLLFSDFKYSWLFLFVGFIYFGVMYSKYRNQGARHYHETETKKNVFNLRKQDNFIRHETGLSNSMMDGANNRKVSGTQKSKLLDL
ncbi:MAG: TFIIB-type zinc ribbon-containing protein [Clostridia bacterium]|nr:TFIIB-type zinc ribbon-containing protein [Clostridia bacterium]